MLNVEEVVPTPDEIATTVSDLNEAVDLDGMIDTLAKAGGAPEEERDILKEGIAEGHDRPTQANGSFNYVNPNGITCSFEEACQRFAEATKVSMAMLRYLAETAIVQFYNHGDLRPCSIVFELIPATYGRRQAFKKWLMVHAPVTEKNMRFVKDKEAGAIVMTMAMLQRALNEPFWDFSPPKEDIPYGKADIVKDLERVITKRAADRQIPDDAETTKFLHIVDMAVQKLAQAAGTGNVVEQDGKFYTLN